MTEAIHPVLTAAATYRAQLLRQEDAAVRRLVAAYGTAYQRMGAQIQALQEALDGQPLSFAQATRLTRLRALREQIQGEIGRFGVIADNELEQTARQAIELGLNHSTGLVEAHFVSQQARNALRASFTQLQPAQVETLVGFLADDSPLRQGLVGQLGETMATRVSDRLIDGITRGFNPNKTAAIVRRELGVGLAWAINTTRTANLWAYREATRANYAANPRVVSGWTWYATLDGRVCGNCLSQHGRRYPLSASLNGHHQCRCTMIPELPLAKSLGIDLPEIEPGEQWFRRQDEAMQRGILGPGMWSAWRAGAVSFDDFRGHTYDHPAYGEMQRMPTMAQLGLQRYYTRAERALARPTRPPDAEIMSEAQAAAELAKYEAMVAQRDLALRIRVDADKEALTRSGFTTEKLTQLFDIGAKIRASVTVQNWGSADGIVISGNWTDEFGSPIGEVTRSLFPEEKRAHLDVLAFDAKYIGNGLGMKVARSWFRELAAAGYEEAELYAGLSIGKYAWAKEGAEYADPTRAQEATQKFRVWAQERGLGLADDEYPTFTRVLDVATWRHPRGQFLTGKDIKNADVPPDLSLPAGKAFMLDDSPNGHGWWDAVIDLTKQGGNSGK